MINDTIMIKEGATIFELNFESINSNWDQGILVFCKGENFEVEGQKIKNGIYLWGKNVSS